jgi:hypothetical protein
VEGEIYKCRVRAMQHIQVVAIIKTSSKNQL